MTFKNVVKLFVFELRMRRQSILIGAGIGLAAAYYFISQGVEWNTISQGSSGLVDVMMSRNADVQVAKTKMYVAFAFFGGLVGYVFDFVGQRLRLFSVRKKRSVRGRK